MLQATVSDAKMEERPDEALWGSVQTYHSGRLESDLVRDACQPRE